MVPILFRIGSHIVHSYTLCLVAGMLAGTWLAYRLAKGRLAEPSVVLDAGFWALLGGLLGGRAGYVAANWAYYVDHLDQAPRLWEGGLSWHGALIGGCAAVFLWLAGRRGLKPPAPDWRDLFDAIAPGVALGGAFGWLGCLLTGSAYGAEASGVTPPLSWLTAYLPDIYGVESVRYLTQPLMMAWCAILAGLLLALRRGLPRGLAFPLFLFAYAAGDLAVSALRGDGAWRLGLWLSQWVALVEMCAAFGLGVYAWAGREAREGQ